MKVFLKLAFVSFISLVFLFSCVREVKQNDTIKMEESSAKNPVQENGFELVVLGIAQDGGAPQINCQKECCQYFRKNDERHFVSCLGLIDHDRQKTYLFDATPDFTEQTACLSAFIPSKTSHIPDGIFLTHGHIGHYTGLMYLGKEGAETNSVPVHAMPRMIGFLQENGPWSQLSQNKNIELHCLTHSSEWQISPNLSIIPYHVPHRDEFSETVGYKIIGPNKSVLFIPDIDKWKDWDRDIITEIEGVDYAFIDATFYDNQELPNRDMSLIPHPFVSETMMLLQNMSEPNKNKVHFIHMNHTNPMLNEGSAESIEVLKAGFNISRQGMHFSL